MQSLGLSSLLARSKDDYVRIASVLARSGPGGSNSKRDTLKNMRAAVEAKRDSSPLFDLDGWVANWERLMRVMWETADATASASPESRPSARHLILSGHTGW